MRLLLATLFLPTLCLLIGSVVGSSSLFAQEVSPEVEVVDAKNSAAPIVLTPELIDAHREYQLAQLRWRQFRFHELPQQRRLLDQQVRLTEAEVRVLKRRLRDYRPFLQVGRYSPVLTAAENDRLALLQSEQELKLLRNERINLLRSTRQHNQLYQLEVLRTAAQVLAVQKSQAAAAELR